MVPKTQSAKTPVAGPPTTVVRKPFANTPCNNAPPGRPTCSGRATLLPAWPLNGTCVSHKSPLFRSGIYPNETHETHYRYGECVFSYDECPICTLSRYDSGLVTETKARHHVSPHTPAFHTHAGPTGPDTTTSQMHRHQLRKREFVCQPLD